MKEDNTQEPLSEKLVLVVNKRLLIAFIFIGISVYFAISSDSKSNKKETYLSDKQIAILSDAIKLDPDMSNDEYDKMRKAYKNDIKINLNTLTTKEQNKVWSDYKELYILQLKIKNDLLSIKPFNFLGSGVVSYDYKLNIINTTENSNFLTIYSDGKIARTYKARFEKPLKLFSIKKIEGFLKVYLPYFDTKIYIPERDKEKITLINQMMEKSFVLLQKNKKAFGIL